MQLPKSFAVFGEFSQIMWETFLSIIVLLFAIFIRKILHRSIDRIAREMKIEPHYIRPVKTMITLFISIVAVTIVLAIFKIEGAVTGMLAGAGFLGIVVGFAAQNVLADVIAGILLYMDAPFKIGDWIEVAGEEGIVVDITLRSTRIKNFDGVFVSIPNRIAEGEVLKNKVRDGKLRINVEIGIDYDSDIGKAIKIAHRKVKEYDYVHNPEVTLTGFGESSINLKIFFWIDNPTMEKVLKAKTEITKGIKEEFNRNGIKIPFPHIELIKHES